ncbi:MAG: hypothetical protein HYX93_03135 [Chloroflexi bacterium]|nr:hypothetical protein [Chloroflexota bacterium]
MEERDFFRDRFSEEELRQILQGRRASEVFSWKSPSFKALGLPQGTLGDDDLIRLMLREPRLVRRPLVKVGELLVIGASQKALEEYLGRV